MTARRGTKRAGSGRPIRAFDPAKRRFLTVGHVEGDSFDLGERQASRHMLRHPEAWAVDAQALADAEADGARTVRLRDVETGRDWVAPIEAFHQHGITLDRGAGRQVALPLRYWNPNNGQLTLFAGGGYR